MSKPKFIATQYERLPSMSAVFGAAETEKTINLSDYVDLRNVALLEYLKVRTPDWTNVVTLTVSVQDSDGLVIDSKAAIARNSKNIYADVVGPIDNNTKLVLTLSGVPGAGGGTVTIQPIVSM